VFKHHHAIIQWPRSYSGSNL